MKVIHHLPLIGVILWGMLLSSCSSMNEMVAGFPRISELKNSECVCKDVISTTDSRASESGGMFEIVFDGPDAACSFTSLAYPCDFEKANVNVEYSNGVLAIVEFPSSDMSDCRCSVDVSFVIIDIPEEDFILKLYHGDAEGRYNADVPVQSYRVLPGTGSITIPYQLPEEEKESVNPYISQLSNTGCGGQSSVPEIRATRSKEDVERTFEMCFRGAQANCNFTALAYPCDFEKVNVKVAFKDDILTIVEYPSSESANCICDVDASFTIMNMPRKEFMLKIYRGSVSGEYSEEYPVYSGMVDPNAGDIKFSYPE